MCEDAAAVGEFSLYRASVKQSKEAAQDDRVEREMVTVRA